MTTRLEARLVRMAVVTALAGVILAVPAAPAMAAPPAISILSVSSEHVKSGAPVRVQFRATNNGSSNETVFVAVSGGLTCTAGCSASQAIGPGQSKTFDATVVAPKVHDSEVSGRNLAVSVRIGTQTAFDHKMIFVHGANQPLPGSSPPSAAKPPSTVSQVSGQVRDGDGKPIDGAALTVRDSAGHEYATTSGPDGTFSVKSSAGKPITAGPITVEVRKDGYDIVRATVQGATGGAATVQLTLAAAGAMATPSQTPPSSSAEAAAPLTLQQAGDEGGISPLWMILGGLLVAAGFAVALLPALIRRRKNAPVVASEAALADAPTAVLRIVPPATPGGNQQQDGYGHRPFHNDGGYPGPAR